MPLHNLKRLLLILPFTFLCAIGSFAQAQNELDVIKRWIEFSDAPNSLYHHLGTLTYKQLDKRKLAVDKLRSLAGWQQRQKLVRNNLLQVIGMFPQRTPLNAEVVKTFKTEQYRVEHIIYQSQPGFYVTSSMFIPGNLKSGIKAPAIIYCSGHSENGYRNNVYQQAILNLVAKGFVVFAFDPVGQGERLEYYDPSTKKSLVGARDEEHSYAGAQPFITGGSLANYMIWDGVRAIDYLLTRTEVDPERIGITGRSGGGTQSAYIAAVDDRIKALATENYITSFKRLIQSSGPQDAEQDFFNGIYHGLDMADLLEVRAPKPALMISTTRDVTFSIQGAIETATEVATVYKAYNKYQDFSLVTDDAPHASTKKGREAMYAFFQKYLNNPGDSTDKEVKVFSPEEMQVTGTGQVSTSFKSETIFSLNKKVAEKCLRKLQTDREKLPQYLGVAVQSAKVLSGYAMPLPDGPPVFMGRFQREGYVIEKYYLPGDYVIPYLLFRPDHSNRRSLVYLNPAGKSADALPGGQIEWFVKNGFTVLVPDLLGIGEMGKGIFRGDSYIKGVSYNEWFLSMLTKNSITGIQAGDISRLVNLLSKDKGIDEVYALAVKELTPVLLHAAAFNTSIRRIALIDPLTSYRALVMEQFYDPAFIHSAVPGALASYDLPDLAASLAPRRLMIAVSKDTAALNEVEGIARDQSVIRASYEHSKASNQLILKQKYRADELVELFNEWIK